MTAAPITVGDASEYAALQTEIWGINEDKGWHEEPFNPREARALIHSEISEALEAYREHGLEDQTDRCESCATHDPRDRRDHGHLPASMRELPKPEGVGSELADAFIRLLHYQARRGIVAVEPDMGDLATARTIHFGRTFGEDMDLLHYALAVGPASCVPAHLVVVAKKHGLDLMAEVRRKIAYNRTRPYRHGGKRL